MSTPTGAIRFRVGLVVMLAGIVLLGWHSYYSDHFELAISDPGVIALFLVLAGLALAITTQRR